MPLDAGIVSRLLAAIESDRLLFLCGAGLSMGPPSSLPGAVKICQKCFDRWQPNEPSLDLSLRSDLNGFARHFVQRGEFGSTFVSLVPWDDLYGPPNPGHAAIADFLICRAGRAAVSTNFDDMIERWAANRRRELRGARTGQEIHNFAMSSSPLVKLHGCVLHKSETLWTDSQLTDTGTKARIDGCAEWLKHELPGKHLVVCGFWSDWRYLNAVLTHSLSGTTTSAVTVLDPADSPDLTARAPELWATLTSMSSDFGHVQISAESALNELRTEFSRVWARKFYALGVATAPASGLHVVDPSADALDVDTLYDLRRDAEGVDSTFVARSKEPRPDSASAAALQLFFLQAGAAREGTWFRYSGRTVRVVNGAGRSLQQIRESFKEPPTLPSADFVVCAGAENFNVAARVISSGTGRSMVRPAPGGPAAWITGAEARMEFGL